MPAIQRVVLLAALGTGVMLASCTPPPAPTTAAPTAPATTAPPALAAPAGATEATPTDGAGADGALPEDADTPSLPAPGPPPWAAPALARVDVPAVYLAQWAQADNRAHCAPMVLQGADAEAGISLRRANFSGGWAVAFDAPGKRSAFGIAGAGVEAEARDREVFPVHVDWNDGSWASYGPEGGSGPGTLAYLRVAGQDCLYNVWSSRGETHMRALLDSLRRVDADQ